MLISCWSVKGGVGTSVTAAAMAVQAAASGAGSLLVDLAGDGPAVLGAVVADEPGIAEWLAAGKGVPVDALHRIEQPVAPGLALVPRGIGPLEGTERAEVLAALLATEARTVVVDCGRLDPDAGPGREVRRVVAGAATTSLLVTRGCYLALRRVARAPLTPSGVVLLDEPGRVLGPGDVEAIVGVPVSCVVPVDPAVARAVDAGLLATRLPRAMQRALHHG